MGFALAMGKCFLCDRMMSFNPVRVPSYEGEPLCRDCAEFINEERKKRGLSQWVIQPDAYEACDENELGSSPTLAEEIF